jgi:chromosome segregation ATPase
VELLKTFEEKIAYAVEKVKALKEEKNNLEKKIRELENIIKSKDHEIEKITSEKTAVKTQIEALLKELDSIELK